VGALRRQRLDPVPRPSGERPGKLHELQRLFLIEAARNNVVPLDDRGFERVLPDIAGRPMLVSGNTSLLLPGMGGLTIQHVANFRNKSWSLTSQVEIPDGGANGVLMTIGSHHGGFAFYLDAGVFTFCFNYFGVDHTYIRADAPVPAGEHQLQVTFAYDGGGLGKGGDIRLLVDGQQVAAGRLERTRPITYMAEYLDVGRDELSTVTDEYPRGNDNAFTGTIKWIQLEVGDDSHDHLIDPKDFVRVAMARQ
jgi:arylsulfatase